MTTHTSVTRLNPAWLVVDASGQRLGRLATSVAMLLMGKNKPDYSRHQLSGDYVIVINASKVEVTGNASALKTYYRHTGYIGHLRATPMSQALAERPDRVIERAVKGMLPGNRLGRHMLKRLKVYVGDTHPHIAQVNAGVSKPHQEPRRTTAQAPQVEEAAVSEVAAAIAEAPASTEEALAQSRASSTKRTTSKHPVRQRSTSAAKTPAKSKPVAPSTTRRKRTTKQESE
jgi:large subunit ribosomal protein L13